MSRDTSNVFNVNVAAVSSRNFAVAYDFPTSDADGIARFPKSNRGNRANAWHSAYLDGNQIIEWGDDNHSSYGWNSLRRISLTPGANLEDAFLTDWIYSGQSNVDATPSNYNEIKGISHYNNHVEIWHPTERWWFKFFNGGRIDCTTQPAVVTHRVPRQLTGEWEHTYIENYWEGPVPNDWIRDDVGTWWGANATNAIYNPAIDYSYDYDCWLLLGGGGGSDSPFDGCWIIERNPNYPNTQPEPWRIRNFALTGKAEANYVPRYQWRNHGRFLKGSPWFYVFGGREQQLVQGNTPITGITQVTMWASNQGHRINVLTGEIQELPTMPMRMIDGAVIYDEEHNVFVIVGIPHQEYPYSTRSKSNGVPVEYQDGYTQITGSIPDQWISDYPASSYGVVIFDPTDNTYHDVTPAGFVPPSHTNGGFVANDGNIYIRAGSGFFPPLPNNQSQNWKLSYYWRLQISET